MTKTTDSRQLRLLVDGLLASYGIDNLQLALDICSGVKEMFASPTPAHTREAILGRLAKHADRQSELDEIAETIKTRIHINPDGREWEDFIKWAWNKQKNDGETIGRFLDWWLEDEWRAAHAPASPSKWYVFWPQAFAKPEASSFTIL